MNGVFGSLVFVSEAISEKTKNQNDVQKKKKRRDKHHSSAEKLEIGYHQIPNTFNANASTKKLKDDLENLSKSRNNYDSIDAEDRFRSSSGLVGLKNLGNTCFINSALQCLLNVQPLMEYFLSDLHEQEMNESNPLGSKGNITSAFADLVNQVWCETNKFITPSLFLGVVKRYSAVFGDGSQQDSQEFLIFLLDYLHEDLNRVKNKPYVKDKDYESKDAKDWEDNSQEAWREYLRRNRSIVVDLFQGQLKSTLKCLVCGTVSHKFETFMYLSVPISEEMQQASHSLITIDDCIEEFTREEELDETEWWQCTCCKKRTPSTKKIDLWKTPNILIVHFKRFAYTKKSKGKINSFIDFKLTKFDLSSQVAGREKVVPIYDLFAVCNHIGSLRGGHYTAYAKNRDTNEWYHFDDTAVNRVANPKKSILSAQAYVLFYSKTSPEIFQRQTLTFPEFWPHIMNDSHPINNHIAHHLSASVPIAGATSATPNSNQQDITPQKLTYTTLCIQREGSKGVGGATPGHLEHFPRSQSTNLKGTKPPHKKLSQARNIKGENRDVSRNDSSNNTLDDDEKSCDQVKLLLNKQSEGTESVDNVKQSSSYSQLIDDEAIFPKKKRESTEIWNGSPESQIDQALALAENPRVYENTNKMRIASKSPELDTVLRASNNSLPIISSNARAQQKIGNKQTEWWKKRFSVHRTSMDFDNRSKVDQRLAQATNLTISSSSNSTPLSTVNNSVSYRQRVPISTEKQQQGGNNPQNQNDDNYSVLEDKETIPSKKFRGGLRLSSSVNARKREGEDQLYWLPHIGKGVNERESYRALESIEVRIPSMSRENESTHKTLMGNHSWKTTNSKESVHFTDGNAQRKHGGQLKSSGFTQTNSGGDIIGSMKEAQFEKRKEE